MSALRRSAGKGRLCGCTTSAIALVGFVLNAGIPAEATAQVDGMPRWPGPFITGSRSSVGSAPSVGPDGTIYVGVSFSTNPATGMVIALSANTDPKWSFSQPGLSAVEGSPVVFQNRVYFGTMNGVAFGLDARTGEKIWEIPTGDTCYINATPAVAADGIIYVGIGDYKDFTNPSKGGIGISGLMAVYPDGAAYWRRLTHGAVDAAPVIGADGTVFVGTVGGRVYAFTPAGRDKWEFDMGGPVWGSPAIGFDGTIYVADFWGRIVALDPTSGRLKWELTLPGASVLAGPAIAADGTIYIGGTDFKLHAISPLGLAKWAFQAQNYIATTPLVRADGTIIFGSDDRRIYCVGPDGKERWQYLTTYLVRASPVVADGVLYAATLDGRLYALASTSDVSRYAPWPMFQRTSNHVGLARTEPAGANLTNVSSRGRIGAGHSLIAGFVTTGAAAKNYLVRGIGPTLRSFGVDAAATNPTLRLLERRSGVTMELARNDDWSDERAEPNAGSLAATIGAFPLEGNSRDAALVRPLSLGEYTAVVDTRADGPEIALVEVFDGVPEDRNASLINIATRAHVSGGEGVLIAGFVAGPNSEGSIRVLIRAVGPGLEKFGVTNVLARPVMSLFSGGHVVMTNAGWTSGGALGDIAGAAAAAGAFPLETGSRDCAAIVTLTAGSYTIMVSGENDTVGEALVEVYRIP